MGEIEACLNFCLHRQEMWQNVIAVLRRQFSINPGVCSPNENKEID
jgi:hypothetical protein